jgi:hypothetical protein
MVSQLLMGAQAAGCRTLFLIALFCLSCGGDLNERIVPCPDGTLVESVHTWGQTVTLRPASGHEWPEILRDPFRQYGSPPVTPRDLDRRYGSPARTWLVEGRPFFEYSLPAGRLQLGLEEDKSGSDVYRSWRLRLRTDELEGSELLEGSSFSCASSMLTHSVDLVLLSRQSGLPKVSIHLRDNRFREVVWLNLGRP